MSMKAYIRTVHQGIKHIINTASVIKDGQTNSYAILQTAHRLEKGLCIRNPRSGWGFDKAETLADLIAAEKNKNTPDQTAIQIGEAVLAAYIDAKEKLPDEKEKLDSLKQKIACNNLSVNLDAVHGGTILMQKKDMIQAQAVEQLFLTRHSVRDYDDTPVDNKKLERAVSLALRAPSACNRQASQIYVITGEDRKKAEADNEYNADKYLIITGNMNAFTLSEFNDWIVSTSVFCGYLSLALHAEGIGSCIFRKNLMKKTKYTERIRKLCHIPNDEQIILEMAIGNYKPEFAVPVSFRRDAKEVLHYKDS